MMKAVVLVLLILAVCESTVTGNSPQSARTGVLSVNTLLDNFVSEFSSVASKEGYEPLTVPDINMYFGLINLSLRKGRLEHWSDLQKGKNVTVLFMGPMTNVRTNFTLDRLEIDYDAVVRFLFFTSNVKITAHVEDAYLGVDIGVSTGKESVELNNLQTMGSGRIRMQVEGLPGFVQPVEVIAESLAHMFKRDILQLLESRAHTVAGELLTSMDMSTILV